MIKKQGNAFVDEKLEIIFHKSEMVETIASLRSLLVETDKNNQGVWLMEKRMANFEKSYRYSLNEYGKAYAGWLLIMDLSTYISCKIYEETGQPVITFEEAEKEIIGLSDEEFFYVFAGGPAENLSYDSVTELLYDPDNGDPELLERISNYISAENIKIFAKHIDSLREDLQDKIRVYRSDVFHYVWDEIQSSIDKSIKRCGYECYTSPSIESYIANISNQIQVCKGCIILDKKLKYTYDVDEIKRIHIFLSAFPGEELYMDKYDDNLIIYYNLNLSEINSDVAAPADLAETFKALGDGNRLKLLRILWDAPATTKYLANVMKLAPSTVSAHLKVLKQANLINSKTIRKYVYYEANRMNVGKLGEYLSDYFKEES